MKENPKDLQQSTPPKQCNFSKLASVHSSRVTVSGCAVHFRNVLNMQEHRCTSSPQIKAFLEQSAGKTRKNKKQLHRMWMLRMSHLWRRMWEHSREINKRQWLLPLASHYIFFFKFLQHSGKSMHLVSDAHISAPCCLLNFWSTHSRQTLLQMGFVFVLSEEWRNNSSLGVYGLVKENCRGNVAEFWVCNRETAEKERM